VAELQREHPTLTVEIITVTRPVLQHRSGLDIEVVVGEPHAHRVEAIELGSYILGMYASRDYPAEHDALDAPRRLVPTMRDAFTSTNVFVHVEATRAGAGIGFLPCFMADRHPDLVRLLPEEIQERLPYWMVLRPDSLRQPAVAAVASALRARTAAFKPQMMGTR
jgi:DNA-binding transcriptional LysR family regulator